MTQTKGFFPLFSQSDRCAGRGKCCVSQGKFSRILLNLSDLPPLLSSSAVLVLQTKNGLGQTEKRWCRADTQNNEPVFGHLLTVPSLQKSFQSPYEAGLGCHRKPCWCESGYGKEGSSLDNQCTRICQPGHSSGGLWGIISFGFCGISLYYLLTDMSTKLPFNTGQSESSEVFGFLWSWENMNVCLAVGWCSSNCDCHRIVLITPSIHIGLMHESPGRGTYALGGLSSAQTPNLFSGNYHVFISSLVLIFKT